MCGIVGVYKTGKIDVGLKNKFYNLMINNIKRGDSAYGFMTEKLLYKELGEFMHLPNISGTQYILGHVRAPTEGSSNIISNTHPFETEHFFLAHNGLLYNWKDLAKEWNLNVNMDSKLIVNMIESLYTSEGSSKSNVVESIKFTCQKLQGSFACWLLDKQTNNIYIFRCISPIKYTDRYFSSEKGDTELPEGKIMLFNTKQIVDIFDYYTPYVYDFPELKKGD